MNRLSLLLIFSLSLPITARADEASKRAKAEEMVNLLHTDQMVNQVSQNIVRQVNAAAEKLAGENPTPEVKTKVANFEKAMSDKVENQVGWTAMKSAFTDIYAKTYTEPELDAILAFYKSPAGSAFLEKTPTVNRAASSLAQSKMNTLQPDLRASFEEFRRSVTPEPAPAATPAPAAAPSLNPAPTVKSASPTKPATPSTPK